MITATPKKTTHIAQEQGRMQAVIDRIIAITNMTLDEYIATMFELGCEFAEYFTIDKDTALETLTTEASGFWSWWVAFYVNDDERLLREKHNKPKQLQRYRHTKERLIFNF